MPALRSLAPTLLALAAAGCGEPAPGAPAVALTELMGGGDRAGFERADAPREFRFPADHGPHRGFQTEWWYVTGNLSDVAGRPYGFHLTLFRRGLAADAEGRAASLAADELYLGHFAIADGAGGAVHPHERTARGAGGLAGARSEEGGARVWLEDWEIRLEDEGGGPLTLGLRAREGGDALELELRAEKAPVLQGDAGLSRKGAGPGQASYYYAVTRLAAEGTLELDGERLTVAGSAWLDREWSTSALGPDQVGWDWFALQLDDGTDLMLYQMRLADGGIDATSHGSLTAADGAHRRLDTDAYSIAVLDRWTSPRSGGRYPSGWRLSLPGEALELEVRPLLVDQELPFAVVYWEGAVRVTGTRDGRPIAGVGFVELTGYADAAAAARRAGRR